MTEDSTDFAALSYYRQRVRRGERVNFLLKTYAFSGIISVLFGGGFVIYSKLKIDLTRDEQLALGVAFVGAFVAVLSYGMISYRKAIYERDAARFAEHQAVGRFIDAWARFEEASKEAAFGPFYDSPTFSFRETFNKLRSDGKFSKSDQIMTDDLLQTRNSIVHGFRRLPVAELEEAIDQILSLITKLS